MENFKSSFENTMRRPWSDLPCDILEIVMKNLFIADEARMRIVCRGWNSVRDFRLFKQLPLLLMTKSRPSWQPLFDPSIGKTHLIDLNLGGTHHVLASKHDWLLMRQGKITPYFFNVFTAEKIDLPRLDAPNLGYINSATFSSPPTSPDCTIFTCDLWNLYTCSPGDKTWKSEQFGFPTHVNFTSCSFVYMRGILYCCSISGTMVSYNVSKETWNLLVEQRITKESLIYNFLLESDGELLLVVDDNDGPKGVFRLNHLSKEWDAVKSLGVRALFLGPTSFAVSESSSTPGIANLIFTLPKRNKPEYYAPGSETYAHTTSETDSPYILSRTSGYGMSWIQSPVRFKATDYPKRFIDK